MTTGAYAEVAAGCRIGPGATIGGGVSRSVVVGGPARPPKEVFREIATLKRLAQRKALRRAYTRRADWGKYRAHERYNERYPARPPRSEPEKPAP